MGWRINSNFVGGTEGILCGDYSNPFEMLLNSGKTGVESPVHVRGNIATISGWP